MDGSGVTFINKRKQTYNQGRFHWNRPCHDSGQKTVPMRCFHQSLTCPPAHGLIKACDIYKIFDRNGKVKHAMRAYERFLKYVTIHTTGRRDAETVPSTPCQFELARYLVEEMKGIGITDARVDEKCYVYGSIPATPGFEDGVRLGFISHMDTSPDFSGEGVRPLMHANYDGGAVALPGGIVLTPEIFPHLPSLKGRPATA